MTDDKLPDHDPASSIRSSWDATNTSRLYVCPMAFTFGEGLGCGAGVLVLASGGDSESVTVTVEFHSIRMFSVF